MGDFFWVIVVISIVGSLISSALKKKKREEAQRNAQQRQPQRSMPLSDIEKAFMMAQQPPSPQSGEYAQPRPQYAPPQAAPRPAYTPPPAYTAPQATYAPMQARNIAPMEARNTAPMEARGAAPMEARNASAVPPHPMYASRQVPASQQSSFARNLPPDFYSGSMGPATREGVKDAEGDGPQLETINVADLESVTDSDLETAAPIKPARQPLKQAARKGVPLGLFENQNEYIKAIIYSEILNRRAGSHAHSTKAL